MTRLTLLILLIVALAAGVAIGFYGLPDRKDHRLSNQGIYQIQAK